MFHSFYFFRVISSAMHQHTQKLRIYLTRLRKQQFHLNYIYIYTLIVYVATPQLYIYLHLYISIFIPLSSTVISTLIIYIPDAPARATPFL